MIAADMGVAYASGVAEADGAGAVDAVVAQAEGVGRSGACRERFAAAR